MSIIDMTDRMAEQLQARARAMGFRDVNAYLDHLEDEALRELLRPKLFPENMGMTKVPEMQRT